MKLIGLISHYNLLFPREQIMHDMCMRNYNYIVIIVIA